VQRFDLLHLIHKALRHAILTFNLESGRTDFADADAVAALSLSWSELRTNLGSHAQHEDEFMFPLLRVRAPGEPRHPFGWDGEVEALSEDHVRIKQLESEMDALLRSVESAPDTLIRRLLGREFHRTVQRYTAMCLLHFDDEERRFMPRLWMLYGDEELIRAFDRIMTVIGPEERAYGMRHMVEALDPAELDELQERLADAS
jgi:hypothetical protein